MNELEVVDSEDLAEALLQGRPLRRARHYHAQVAMSSLDFKRVTVDAPDPTGRALMVAAGMMPPDEYGLFAILASGDFEEIRLDERFDLYGHGAHRVVAFKSDRYFKLTLNHHQITWGAPQMPAMILYRLADASDHEDLFLKVPGKKDREIPRDATVDLAGAGIEHFFTAPVRPEKFEIIVNSRPKHVLGRTHTFEQIVQLAFPGAVPEPNVVYSMTYRHAFSKPHAGELAPGGTVEVKNGTIFNVTKTIKS